MINNNINKWKLSIGILIKHEFDEFQQLLNYLNNYIIHKQYYEIVILYDGLQTDIEFIRIKNISKTILYENNIISEEFPNKFYNIKVEANELQNFASQRNILNNYCSKSFSDYILQIDCDEVPGKYMINNWESIIRDNIYINDMVYHDLIFIPRINIVTNITEEDIKKWGWTINESNWINFPDYQGRLYKNSNELYWEGLVHERINKYNTENISTLALDIKYALQHHCYIYHKKTINKQKQQNKFYAEDERFNNTSLTFNNFKHNTI